MWHCGMLYTQLKAESGHWAVKMTFCTSKRHTYGVSTHCCICKKEVQIHRPHAQIHTHRTVPGMCNAKKQKVHHF